MTYISWSSDLSCISDPIKQEGIKLRILVQSDTFIDRILFVVNMTYISWSSDFASYLWLYLIDKHQILGTCSVSHLIFCRSLCSIFHGPVILPCNSDYILIWILVLSDTVNEPILFVGHCDLYFMIQ